MDDLISRAAAIDALKRAAYWQDAERKIAELPAVDAIPMEWLNERHRMCCEDVYTDLMDAITVLCNEYHVCQKEQEAKDGKTD